MPTAEQRMRSKIATLVKQRDAIPSLQGKATGADLKKRNMLFAEVDELYGELDVLVKRRALRPVAGKAG